MLMTHWSTSEGLRANAGAMPPFCIVGKKPCIAGCLQKHGCGLPQELCGLPVGLFECGHGVMVLRVWTGCGD